MGRARSTNTSKPKVLRQDGHRLLKDLFERYGIPYTKEDISGEKSLAHNWNRGEDIRDKFKEKYGQDIQGTEADSYGRSQELTADRIVQTPDGPAPTKMAQVVDLDDVSTSELLGERGKQWGIDAEEAQEIETAFIDKVWGTDRALVDSLEGGERAWDDPDSGFDATWGLDLRRIYDKDLNLSTSELTDYLADGPIDWPSYEKDPYYGEALKKAGINITDANLDESWRAGKIRELTYKKSEKGKTAGGGFFRTLFGNEISGDEFPEPTEWEGMYDKDRIQAAYGDLYIDGERQETLLERIEKDRYKPGEDEEWQANKIQRDEYVERDFSDLKTKEYRSTLGLPSRTDFGLTITPQKTPVKKPTNLPV